MIKTLFFAFALCCMSLSIACVSSHSRRITRVWYNQEGCRVIRSTYPCYNAHGNLKVQTVRCPDGRRWRRKWLHPDNRCQGAPAPQQDDAP